MTTTRGGGLSRTRAVWIVLAVAAVIGVLLLWRPGTAPVTTGGSPAATTARARSTTAPPTSGVDQETRLPWVSASKLPSQAREVLTLVDQGGPFPYAQDGATFGNNERLLPIKPNGFYKEYTVRLPGSPDRGPVRIIVGGNRQWFFYTSDHYASFARIQR